MAGSAAAVVTASGDLSPSSHLRSALSQARWRLIPLLGVCYLVAYMDRVNISFAAETMNRQLHISPDAYGLGAGLFFLTYALCEVPSNWLLLRFGARRWLARIMLTWGLLAAAMVLVHGRWSLYSLRMLLGCAEAGYFPGVLFYLAQWFPVRQRARAISLFYIALPLSSVVMGGLAGTLLGLNGHLGLAGWQWLFLVEATPAVLLSAALWFGLPDGPASARWLTAPQREAVQQALAADDPSSHPAASAHGIEALSLALRSPRVWGIGMFLFVTLGVNYAIGFSLPLMLRRATGWDVAAVGWLVAATGGLGALAMLVGAWHSDRTGERRWHIALPALGLGLSVLVAGLLGLRGWGAVAALAIALVCEYALQGPILSSATEMLRGDAGALGVAVMNMCSIGGGFAGPFWMGWMREHTGGYAWGIGALCLPCFVASAGIAWLLRRPRTEAKPALTV